MEEVRYGRVPDTAVDIVYTVDEGRQVFLLIDVGSHLDLEPYT